MPNLETPTILITRPVADAERFLALLRAETGVTNAIVCPAFGFEKVDEPAAPFDSAIFTSRTGVSFAPAGEGRIAYCVGEATAQLAQEAGYAPISANGSAEELVEMILKQAPSESLLHIRGEISQGNVTERLVHLGLNCTDVIAYRKVPLSPTTRLTEAVRDGAQLVLPLFSAETVSIIAGWPLCFKGCVVVAISDVVAKAAQDLLPEKVIVSVSPDMRGMAASIGRLTA